MVEWLALLAFDYPARIVDCLELLWRADERGGSVIDLRDKAPAILGPARASNDERARTLRPISELCDP